MNELLKRIYYDAEQGYGGLNKLYLKAHNIDKHIKREDVKAFLDEQPINQQYFHVKKSSNSFIASRPLYEFQIDITYIENVTTSSFNYILTCIDVFTKIADAESLNDKSGESALRGIKAIFSRMGKPEQIYCDKGKEFSNKYFTEYLEENRIELIMVRRHAPFIERFNKTFKTMIYKIMNNQGFHQWKSYIPMVIKNYNNSYHRTIRMTPNEAKDNPEKAVENISLNASVGKSIESFSVGDKVRLLLKKGDFTRGYKPTYSKRVYEVEDVEGEYVKIDGDWVYKYDVKKFGGVEKNDEEDEGEEVGKNVKQNRLLKTLGINQGNVVENKRERKPNFKYI